MGAEQSCAECVLDDEEMLTHSLRLAQARKPSKTRVQWHADWISGGSEESSDIEEDFGSPRAACHAGKVRQALKALDEASFAMGVPEAQVILEKAHNSMKPPEPQQNVWEKEKTHRKQEAPLARQALEQDMLKAAFAMNLPKPWTLAHRAAILTRVGATRLAGDNHFAALHAYNEALDATVRTGRLRIMDGVLLVLDTASVRATCGDIAGAYDGYNLLRGGKGKVAGTARSTTSSISSFCTPRRKWEDKSITHLHRALEELGELLSFMGPTSADPFIAHARDSPHVENLAKIQLLTRLGAFKVAVLDYDMALAAYSIGCQICEQTQWARVRESIIRSLHDALVQVGMAMCQRGNASAAFHAYDLAEEVLDHVEEGQATRRAMLQMRVGAAYHSSDDLSTALLAYNKARDIFTACDKLESKDGALLLKGIALARQASEDWRGALAAYYEALDLDHRLKLRLWDGAERIPLLTNIGSCRYESGDLMGSTEAFTAAQNLAERHGVVFRPSIECTSVLRTSMRLDLACSSYLNMLVDFPAP